MCTAQLSEGGGEIVLGLDLGGNQTKWSVDVLRVIAVDILQGPGKRGVIPPSNLVIGAAVNCFLQQDLS